MFNFGKSIATSSTSMGSPKRLRAPGNTDVPVWIVTGHAGLLGDR